MLARTRVLLLVVLLAFVPTSSGLVTTYINQTTAYTTDGFFEGRVIVGNVTRDEAHMFHVEGASLLNGTLTVNGTVTLGEWGESFQAQIVIPEFTADRTLTLPDASGTLALVNVAQSWSGEQTFNDGVVVAAGKALRLMPTATGSLPAAQNGQLVYDATAEVFKAGIAGVGYQTLPTLERAQTWPGAQTFSNGVDVSAGTVKVGGTTVLEADRDIAVTLTPNADNALNLGGSLRRFTTAFVTGIQPGAAPLDIVTGSDQGIRLADQSSDVTTKEAYFRGRHYLTAEEDVLIFDGTSTASANTIFWGGGASAFNAATKHSFYAAATNNILTGTLILDVTTAGIEIKSGSLVIGGDTSVYRDAADTLRTGDTLIVDGGLNLRRNGFNGALTTETLTAGRTFTFPDASGDVATVPAAGSTAASISLTLGTFRTPSTTRPTHVTITCDWQSSVASEAGDLTFTWDGRTTANAFHGQNPLAAGTWKTSYTISFVLPPNATYRPNTATGTGSFNCNAIELTL